MPDALRGAGRAAPATDPLVSAVSTPAAASLTAYDAPTAANYHSLLWLTGLAFIACTSIAAWCVVAMMLTGLHR